MSSGKFDTGIGVDAASFNGSDGFSGIESIAGGVGEAMAHCGPVGTNGIIEVDRTFFNGNEAGPGGYWFGD